MAKKKKPKYYVDVFDNPDCAVTPRDFEKFRSLKKAVRFAINHELSADRIVDAEGNPVPDLDLDAPQWWNHRRLETEYKHAAMNRAAAAAKLEQEQDAHRNRQVAMIQAGYVPLELITARLQNVQVEHRGLHDTTATLTLSSYPGPEASQYGRTPYAVFLEALHESVR